MAAIRILLGIICLAVTCRIGKFERNLLKPTALYRQQLISTAEKEIGVRELTGKNDGPRVESYLSMTGLKKGQPWCAAFISWVFYQNGYIQPNSAWTPALFPAARIVNQAEPGNLLGIYFPELKRIAHVGLIAGTQGDWIISIEGNTNINGSREGDGVYLKRRHKRTIYQIADWVTAGKRMPQNHFITPNPFLLSR